MKNHQREIEKLRNDMENSIHFTQQSRIINDRNNEKTTWTPTYKRRNKQYEKSTFNSNYKL